MAAANFQPSPSQFDSSLRWSATEPTTGDFVMLRTTSILFAALGLGLTTSIFAGNVAAGEVTHNAPPAIALEGPMPCPGGTDTIIDATETHGFTARVLADGSLEVLSVAPRSATDDAGISVGDVLRAATESIVSITCPP